MQGGPKKARSVLNSYRLFLLQGCFMICCVTITGLLCVLFHAVT